MKVWCAVYTFTGIINDMKVFRTFNAAEAWFDKVVKEEGGVDLCDPDYYMDGNNRDKTFYWFDGDENEITIRPVWMEG